MNEDASIEFLILANHIEAINGLLYISGGGWTDLHRPIIPNQGMLITHFGIGISILVPWDQTNREHSLSINVEDADGIAILTAPPAPITVGRPPTLALGSEQHAIVALGIDFAFPRTGSYRVVARLNDRDERTWGFRIHDVTAAAPVPNAP